MELLPVLLMGLLVLLSSQTESEANDADVCGEATPGVLLSQDSSVNGLMVEKAAVNNDESFRCLLYSTKQLNCSWSFLTLHQDAHLSVIISICSEGTTIHSLNQSSVERVGSMSLTLSEHDTIEVILQFNITLHDNWTVYLYAYEVQDIEVLPPPRDVTASIKGGGVLVTWSKPTNMEDSGPWCFEYQLDMGNQGRLIHVITQLNYTEPNADPSHTYRVRMRTKITDTCIEKSHWSDWSHTATVERTDKLSLLLIISISLGLPMILLAVLLLVRHQRVYEVLFPPIPRPPQKYKGFLEKNETLNFFYPATSAEPVEEITEVEDTGRTL
ncbi:interleukin-5 receptor subunit alpha-like [Notolabrus celidotus]|uniref:interleukin-5 receptor subunit alpha-like n=1 Tax=Notolabrus celidotus TaxID=1203425 RepID=UPI00148F7BA6|nr:interleukin-5 receptor subunit alpha-like [Notolabrus celidotus]